MKKLFMFLAVAGLVTFTANIASAQEEGAAPAAQEQVEEADAKGKILLNVTQCKSGTVNMDLYATGASLKHAGVLSGADITTEAALGKLFCLMGRSNDNKWVKTMLEKDLCGEISK